MKNKFGQKSIQFKILEMGKHFLIYGIGSVMQGLVAFLLLPLVTKYLQPTELGAYTLIILAGTILGTLFYLGAQSSITRFYYLGENILDKKQEVTNSSFIMFIGFTLLVITGIIFSNKISVFLFNESSNSNLILLSCISASLSIINTYFITILRLLKKTILFVFANISNIALNFIGAYLALRYSFFLDPIVAFFFGQIIGLSFSILMSSKQVIFLWDISTLKIDGILKHLKFGIPTVFMGLAYYLFDWSDRYAIERYGTLYNVGIYSFGYTIGTIIRVIFVSPFTLIYSTLRMEYHKDVKQREFIGLITTYYILFGLIIVALLIATSKITIHLFANNPEYLEAIKVIPWIILGQYIFGLTGIFDYGIYLSKKTYNYIWIYAIGLAINFSLNAVTITHFGYVSASINKLIAYTIILFVIYFFSKRIYKIAIEKRVKIIVLSGFILVFSIFLVNKFDLNLLFSISIIIFYLLFCYKYIINTKEKTIIISLLSKLKFRCKINLD